MLMEEGGGRDRQSLSLHLNRLMCAGEVCILRMWAYEEGVCWRDCVERFFLSRLVFIMSYNEEDPRFVEIRWL